ncbi:MAG: sulfotransferase family protein [Candidatus Hydrogenedentes bacterium]|nr:sulfotransferase family protein [Candidatus Hydrogenedentota bacterium]
MPASGYITVVSGLPRSGTSLMMQMLHAGGMPVVSDGHRPHDTHNPAGYFEDVRVKRLKHDASWLCEIPGQAIKIVSYLLPVLPSNLNYRILLMERPLAQVLASQGTMLAQRASSSPEEPGVAELMQRQADLACAWMEVQANMPFLVVPYPHVIDDPRYWARQINGFLDWQLDEGAMARCVRPELHRNR